MSKGYEQAIQNLAWKIVEYSDRDLVPLGDFFGGDLNLTVEYLTNHPDIKEDWEKLEEVSATICETYDIEYDQLAGDVWTAMLKYDLSDPKLWN